MLVAFYTVALGRVGARLGSEIMLALLLVTVCTHGTDRVLDHLDPIPVVIACCAGSVRYRSGPTEGNMYQDHREQLRSGIVIYDP